MRQKTMEIYEKKICAMKILNSPKKIKVHSDAEIRCDIGII